MTTLDLIYFNAGGGHRAAALALDTVIREQRRPWRVRLINLVDILDPGARFLRITGLAPEDFYNKRLATGLTIGMSQELKLLQGMIRLGHKRMVGPLQRHWATTEPDLVVSLIPNFNRALCESLSAALPGVPYVTVLTDLADCPPHFWIEPGQPQHLICGTDRAVAQARAAGCADDRIHRTSGMIIRPDFYRRTPFARHDELTALGLDPDRPTGLVMFGGHGSNQMASISQQLADVQLILLCGHNEALAERLRAMKTTAPRVVVGFTSDVSRFMRIADFFVGKPGPGSISEALQQGLPVVTVRNAWTMPQERYNTEWIVEQQVGIVGPSMREIRRPVMTLIDQLPAFKGRVAGLRNRAVFELPGILARILRGSPDDASPSPVAAARDAVGTS